MSRDADLRLELRVKNNLLYHAIFDRWPSVAAFCRDAFPDKVGHNIAVGELLTFKMGPRLIKPRRRLNKRREKDPGGPGEYRQVVKDICAYLHTLPEILFPDNLYQHLKGAPYVHEVSSVSLLEAQQEGLALPAPQEEEVFVEERLKVLSRIIAKVCTRREEKVLILRYGLDGGGARKLQEIADIFQVTRTRIKQVQDRAMLKLRKAATAQLLEELHDPKGLDLRRLVNTLPDEEET